MATQRHRALIVDDETAIRKLIAGELRKQNLECDLAADGVEAGKLLAEATYDVIITDLRMPNRHGHSLAQEALGLNPKPIIIVHTGVIEPRLAKDLLLRGVDDILFKPTDFGFLALKVRSMVDRRAQESADTSPATPGNQSSPPDGEQESPDGPVSILQLNSKIGELSNILPISHTALDVYEMTRSSAWEVPQIAAAIQRDASLTAEVLRLANCSLYNRSMQKILALDEAVVRIGQKRVGELALTTDAVSSLAPRLLPWMDLELTWKRSMAAGIALEALVETGGHHHVEDGLLLSAIMHPLGRVVLGMLFPKQCEAMVKACEATGEALDEQERATFPTSHSEIMAQLLSTWDIPPEVFLPLKFSCDQYSTLAHLSEPSRTKAELVKVAVLLGGLAVDQWEATDLVQFPPLPLLQRLGITNTKRIVSRTRSDLSKLAEFCPLKLGKSRLPAKPLVTRSVAYCNLAGERADLLVELLPSMGLEPTECGVENLQDIGGPLIVNCIGTSPTQFATLRSKSNVVVITDKGSDIYARFAKTLTLPDSYGRFRASLLQHVEQHDVHEAHEPVDSYA